MWLKLSGLCSARNLFAVHRYQSPKFSVSCSMLLIPRPSFVSPILSVTYKISYWKNYWFHVCGLCLRTCFHSVKLYVLLMLFYTSIANTWSSRDDGENHLLLHFHYSFRTFISFPPLSRIPFPLLLFVRPDTIPLLETAGVVWRLPRIQPTAHRIFRRPVSSNRNVFCSTVPKYFEHVTGSVLQQ
jgi:hypothetical protein